MIGQYREKLPSGGEIVVSSEDWHIQYYFQGPDRRYNGTFITIRENDIDDYISAWEHNFEKYLQFKDTIPSGGTFDTKGELGMTIRIGGLEGVCLTSYHMAIRTRESLDQVIHDYEYAKERACKVKTLLQTL